MFDKNTGEVYLKDIDIILTNKTNIINFEQKLNNKSLYKKEIINNYYNYYFDSEHLIEELDFHICICFNPNCFIESIDLILLEKNEPKNWNDWSEEWALELKKKHDAILEKYLGKAEIKPLMGKYTINCYTFLWGNISSYYEPRSANSSILIKYNAR